MSDYEALFADIAEKDATIASLRQRQEELITERNEAESQLLHAQTALRRVMELPLDDDALWWNRDTPIVPKAIIIARQYFAGEGG